MKICHRYRLYGMEASIVIGHGFTDKITKDDRRITIRIAMPFNDCRGCDVW